MGVLTDLNMEPKRVFYYFEQIAGIPHVCEHEQAISNYIKGLAEAKGYSVYQDDLWCLLIDIPGTPGYENSDTVVLHGHMDMIWAKNDNVTKDYLTDTIDLVLDEDEEGKFVRADGTTLGGDNGTGLSFILALMESDDIPHPPLQLMISVQEECGKVGARNFDKSRIKGRKLIDLNWHDHDSLNIGGPRDMSDICHLPYELEDAPAGYKALDLSVLGLMGAHCQYQIWLEKGNAIVLLGRLLDTLQDDIDVKYVKVSGGNHRYSVPFQAAATVMIPEADYDKAIEIIKKVEADFQNEYHVHDPGVYIKCEEAAPAEKVIAGTVGYNLPKLIGLIFNGAQNYSRVWKDERIDVPAVETSTSIGLLEMDDKEIILTATLTSDYDSKCYNMERNIKNAVHLIGNGAYVVKFADCPGWIMKEDSPLVRTCVEQYEKRFGFKPYLEWKHAALEVGYYYTALEGMDMVSFGPKARDPHTTHERLYYENVEPMWEFFKDVMKALK